MSIITIILFFLYCWGLGFTALYKVEKPKSTLASFFLTVSIGLGVFPLLAVFLNLLGIPLDWKIFLLLSMLMPCYALFLKKARPSWRFSTADLFLLGAVLIALLSMFMYATGSFSYPYLEDEDPWGHAIGAKYVALEKNAFDPPLRGGEMDQVLSYIDPYPPAYNILMGILHQTSPHLTWTLKFFNALIISLGFIFFFLFAREFTGHPKTALLATFIIASIPSYLTHFIWAHSYVITLAFPALYAFHKLREDTRWFWIASIIIGSIWVTQNIEQPIKISVMLFIYGAVLSLIHRKIFWHQAAALGVGIASSFIWWGVMLKKYSFASFLKYYGVGGGEAAISTAQASGGSSLVVKLWHAVTNPIGTASRSYTLSDFIHVGRENLINSPVGIGFVISILTIVAVIYLLVRYKKTIVQPEQAWYAITLFWLIYTFWGVNGMTFPISIARGSFRVWLLLVIPVSLLAAEGILFLSRSFTKQRLLQLSILVILLIGVIFTSAIPKYHLNTAIWPTSSGFANPQEAFAYGQWFNTIPDDTNVFLFAPRDKIVLGFGKFSCLWCQDVIDFRETIMAQDAGSIHSFLAEHQYQYVILNMRMDIQHYKKEKYGLENPEEELRAKYQEMLGSSLFQPVYQIENMFIVLKVL